MPRLDLYLLGSPRVELDGVARSPDTRKAIAMLAYLGVTGESHHRDSLAVLLWPDLDQVRARAALRRTLSTLRSLFGDEWFETSREQIELKRSRSLWVDVQEFRSLQQECLTHGHAKEQTCPLCLPPLKRAAALYRSDFLSGFSLRDSLNFDDWQFQESELFRRELASILERLAQEYARQGEYAQAIDYNMRWLALDRLHEPAHRQLMQLFAWSGRREAALRQYRECVRVLDEELGVPPLEQTVALYEAIKENRLSPPRKEPGRTTELPATHLAQPASLSQASILASEPPVSEPPVSEPLSPAQQVFHAPGVLPALPLVGRTRQWNALMDCYAEQNAADRLAGQWVAIEGEPGIGKTRLAEEFLAAIASKGAFTIHVRCYEGEANLSYGPFVEALRLAIHQLEGSGQIASLPSEWLAETARLLPELSQANPGLPVLPPLESPGAQSRFFDAITRLVLASLSGPPAGVLFIDDIHWADTATLELFTYLVRRLKNHSLFILTTVRLEETDAGQNLLQLIGEAQRNGLASMLKLERLSQAQVSELLQVLPDHQKLHGFSRQLYQETEGLPFFLSEYLAVLPLNASLSENGGLQLPSGVRDLLRSRLAHAGEAGRQLLTAAAVIGRSFAFEPLREASGRSEEETVSALESLVAQGLIREIKDPREDNELVYDFSHEKLRNLVYAETNLARRRLLHRRVASALANRARLKRDPGTLAGQIAYHYQQAGEDAQAAEYFRQAGDFARSLFANRDAMHHYQSALSLRHPDQAGLHSAIGDLHTLLGEYRAALSSYQTAAAFSPADALFELDHKLGKVYSRTGDWELAESHFQTCVKELEKLSEYQRCSTVYVDWSLTAYHQENQEKARQLANKALEMAKKCGDDQPLAQAENLLGILARGRGDLPKAQAHLEKSLALAERLADTGLQIAALNNLALVASQGYDIDRAIDLLESALAKCIQVGDRHREAALHSNLADLYHTKGLSDASMEHLRKSVSIYAEIGEQAGEWQPEVWKLMEW